MRCDLILRGQVQGVGCRPWIWQQATQRGLRGWVQNTGDGVRLCLVGEASDIEDLRAALWHLPAPGQIERIDVLPPAPDDTPEPEGFVIRPSPALADTAPVQALMGADLGVCPACLGELFDPGNRRWRHPFIHCPQCGPRYTVTRRLPFDRAHTSLAAFPLCPACEHELHDPQDRRFHDQTHACQDCGPRLSLWTADGTPQPGDPITDALRRLQAGQIVAIKGVGGFHLCCDARQPATVARLRALKRRPTQPLAVMAANLASLRPWCDIGAAEADWLTRLGRPIVLLRQTAQAQAELPGIAPHLAWLGAMLPYTPVHHLLFHEAAGRPAGTAWLETAQDLLLVMTSGNAPGEPLVIDNAAASAQLAPLADALLLHDRDIVARNDDSVLRVRDDGSACWLRRGRGWAPLPCDWPARPPLGTPDAAPVLALGAELKATVCLTQPLAEGRTLALVSPHIGNLHGAATRAAQAKLVGQWLAQRQVQPAAVACDLHPDFGSSRLAEALIGAAPTEARPQLIPVAHHHAHIAAVLAEHADDPRSLQPVLGLALDGQGLGPDRQAWGGELLRVHRDHAERLGHLWPLPLPGGDRAAREPWRLGAAVLHVLGQAATIETRFAAQPTAALLRQWLANASPLPQTTSLGRLFDAAAALLRVLDHAHHEGDAAMRLESLACSAWPARGLAPLPVVATPELPGGLLDWRPLMAWLCAQDLTHDTARAHTAAVFHATLVQGLAQWVVRAAMQHGLDTVVLNGGCLANRLLDEALTQHLREQGLTVWRAAHYPCGDGGLSLGQAWVARHRLRSA